LNLIFCFQILQKVAQLPNVQNVKKAEIRQALRCKLNSLRFSKN
jgi:hypothetical protein